MLFSLLSGSPCLAAAGAVVGLMTSDSAMFDGRRQYHPTNVLSPVPYPLSEPPSMPTSSSAASLAASFLRTTPPHPSSGGYQQAEMADEILAYNHAHAVPLSAAPSASHSSAGLRGVSSTASLLSLIHISEPTRPY